MSTPANPVSLPIQWAPLTASEVSGDPQSIANALNQRLTQLFNSASASTGAAGRPTIPSGIDVAGSTVSSIGEPQSPYDAVSKFHAEANYSAAALAPQLEAGGKNGFKGYRSLNSKSQQESYSTFLNRVANTTPTTNSTVVTAGSPSGGNVTITIPAGQQLLMDGSIQTFSTLTFTVALPSSQAITSISRASGVTTALGTFSGLMAGETVYVSGIADTSFDGNFELTTAGGSSLTWAQPNFADGSSTTGTVSTGGAYYAYLKYPSQTLDISGPWPSDSPLYRLQSNTDGQTLIAVAVVNNSGLVTTQSAGGGTVPAAVNNGNRLLTRL
jgi:hypothetical protein